MKTLKLVCVAGATMMMASAVWATPTAKVLVTDSGATLRFVYDEAEPSGMKGKDWFAVADAEAQDSHHEPQWYACRGPVTKVVFAESFAAYRPKHCGSWFYDFASLRKIEGIANLDTSGATSLAFMFDECPSLESLDLTGFKTTNVTDMMWMFAGCSKLTSLDVTGFDTANVIYMRGMFCECLSLKSLDLSSFDTANVWDMRLMFADNSFPEYTIIGSALETIFVSDKFVTEEVSDSDFMFGNCMMLKGGAGTLYADVNPSDKTYARIDGRDGLPGYFTYKAAPVSPATPEPSANPMAVDVPVVTPAGAFEAPKATTASGVLVKDGAAFGVLQVKVGKASKTGESKVSVTVIGLDGKKYTSKAVKVPTGDTVTKDFEVKKLGTLTLTFGANGFSGTLNGATVTSVDATAATSDGKATFSPGDLSSLSGVLTKYLPQGETVERTEKKWKVAAKAGKLKYVKPNEKKGVAGGLEATGDNIAALKLTYAPKTQTFKGSFKVWIFDATKKKLKSVSAKVTGVVVNGAGYGQAVIKKTVIGELTVK